MITNGTLANRKYVPPRVAVAGRRQAKAQRHSILDLLRGLDRSIVHFILAVVVVSLCGSQFVAWRVGKVEGTLERIASEKKQINDRYIELRSKRAQLMSEKHVRAVAGVRFGLFIPDKGQVIKM